MRHTTHYANDPASMGNRRRCKFKQPKIDAPLWYSERRGTEGPRHDPYGYTELTVQFRGHEVILHEGLAEWLVIDGTMYDPKNQMAQLGPRATNRQMFEAFLGFTPDQLARWDRKLKSRCRDCGSKSFKYASGYPGEEFVLCADCGQVIDSDFYESAII